MRGCVHRHEIETGGSCGERGLGDIIRIESRVVDLDAGFSLELIEDRAGEVLRPRIEVEYLAVLPFGVLTPCRGLLGTGRESTEGGQAQGPSDEWVASRLRRAGCHLNPSPATRPILRRASSRRRTGPAADPGNSPNFAGRRDIAPDRSFVPGPARRCDPPPPPARPSDRR